MLFISCTKKKQRRSHPGPKTAAEKVKEWKEAVAADSARLTQKAPAKGCKKGSMRRKDSANCKLRGVRRRVWGKWVAEIWRPKECAYGLVLSPQPKTVFNHFGMSLLLLRVTVCYPLLLSLFSIAWNITLWWRLWIVCYRY